MQFKALLGPGGQLRLLGAGIVGELDTLVDGWEVDQGVEKTDPMKASFKDLFLIYILRKVIADDGVFSGLDTFNSDSYVYDKRDKAQAEGEKAASLAGAHAPE